MARITACTLDCPDACSLLVHTGEDGRIHIRGNSDHPITAGFTCAKMRRFGRRLQSPNRITTPLLKQASGWKPIEWEEALALCAEKIQEFNNSKKKSESIVYCSETLEKYDETKGQLEEIDLLRKKVRLDIGECIDSLDLLKPFL